VNGTALDELPRGCMFWVNSCVEKLGSFGSADVTVGHPATPTSSTVNVASTRMVDRISSLPSDVVGH
jgi:hypothetical protein